MAEDMRTALHHVAWITHCFRGSCTLYESDAGSFTAVCDLPENQMIVTDVKPFIAEVRNRLNTTNPGCDLTVRETQRPMITGGPGGPQYMNRIFLRVAAKQRGDYS